MTITRVGTNAQYASGWEAAFLGAKRENKKGTAAKKKASAKRSAKKNKK